jgi:small subunit ribosomal protein S6e
MDMVEFKANISDPEDGRSYKTTVMGHHANSLIGKKIGEEFDGIFVGLPGYKLVLTGGSDKQGFPMRKDLPGSVRKKVLANESTGFNPKEKGLRKRKNVRGNTVSPEISQINMRITSHGSKSIEDLLKIQEEQLKKQES